MATQSLTNIFLAAFFLNLLYELLHSLLYKTCIEASLKKYVYLMLKAALFDGCVITIMYGIVSLMFKIKNLFYNGIELSLFLATSLIFAYLWEWYAIQHKRWEYSNNMPLILGVGVTPLVQLALTGFLSLYFVFHFY